MSVSNGQTFPNGFGGRMPGFAPCETLTMNWNTMAAENCGKPGKFRRDILFGTFLCDECYKRMKKNA